VLTLKPRTFKKLQQYKMRKTNRGLGKANGEVDVEMIFTVFSKNNLFL